MIGYVLEREGSYFVRKEGMEDIETLNIQEAFIYGHRHPECRGGWKIREVRLKVVEILEVVAPTPAVIG